MSPFCGVDPRRYGAAGLAGLAGLWAEAGIECRLISHRRFGVSIVNGPWRCVKLYLTHFLFYQSPLYMLTWLGTMAVINAKKNSFLSPGSCYNCCTCA